MQMIIIKTPLLFSVAWPVSVDATLNSKGFSREGNKNDLVDLRAQVIIPFKIHGPVFSRTWWYFKYEPSLRKSIFPFSFSNPFLMRILISTFLARRYALNKIHHFPFADKMSCQDMKPSRSVVKGLFLASDRQLANFLSRCSSSGNMSIYKSGCV